MIRGIYNNGITQLIITGVTLPILLYWGVPISPLTLIGTLFHGLFLSFYLSLCSLFWFTLIIAQHNYWITISIEQITTWWNTLIQSATTMPYIIIHPNTGYIIIVSAVIAYILYRSSQVTLFTATALTSGTVAFLFIFSLIQFPTQLTIGKRLLQLDPSYNKILYIHDHNYTAFISDLPAFIKYTLVPHIGCNYGKPQRIIVIQHGSSKQRAILQSELKKYFTVTIVRKAYQYSEKTVSSNAGSASS